MGGLATSVNNNFVPNACWLPSEQEKAETDGCGYPGLINIIKGDAKTMKEKIRPEIDPLLQRLDAQEREIQRLKELVEGDGIRHDKPTRSRRDVLKLAGAAVIGVAGGAALRVMPAAAANGGPVVIGTTNIGTNTTILSTTGGSSFSSFSDTGSGLTGVSDSDIGVQGAGGAGIGSVGGVFSGARAHLWLVPATTVGPPTANLHFVGDLKLDKQGIIWACITQGTPGVFAPLQTGGANITHFVKVSNAQHSLPSSDGKTWVDMDAVSLSQTITPAFNAQAVISVSADLWTANAGFNQDIGIFISGGAYGAGTIVAWKESGGFAGTFSPNAASVETTQPLVAGTTYVIKVRWKTNQPAAGATIFAGAGPLPAGSAGGGVAGQISPTRLATHLVVDVPSPSVLTIPANVPSTTLPVAPLNRP